MKRFICYALKNNERKRHQPGTNGTYTKHPIKNIYPETDHFSEVFVINLLLQFWITSLKFYILQTVKLFCVLVLIKLPSDINIR